MLAAVVRALTATVLTAVQAGEPAPRPAPEILRAACWRAARDGLAGHGIDPLTGRLVAQTTLVEQLLRTIAPALRQHEDLDLVREQWQRLRAEGTGADRRRAAYRQRSSTHDVVDYVISATCAQQGSGDERPRASTGPAPGKPQPLHPVRRQWLCSRLPTAIVQLVGRRSLQRCPGDRTSLACRDTAQPPSRAGPVVAVAPCLSSAWWWRRPRWRCAGTRPAPGRSPRRRCARRRCPRRSVR